MVNLARSITYSVIQVKQIRVVLSAISLRVRDKLTNIPVISHTPVFTHIQRGKTTKIIWDHFFQGKVFQINWNTFFLNPSPNNNNYQMKDLFILMLVSLYWNKTYSQINMPLGMSSKVFTPQPRPSVFTSWRRHLKFQKSIIFTNSFYKDLHINC